MNDSFSSTSISVLSLDEFFNYQKFYRFYQIRIFSLDTSCVLVVSTSEMTYV